MLGNVTSYIRRLLPLKSNLFTLLEYFCITKNENSFAIAAHVILSSSYCTPTYKCIDSTIMAQPSLQALMCNSAGYKQEYQTQYHLYNYVSLQVNVYQEGTGAQYIPNKFIQHVISFAIQLYLRVGAFAAANNLNWAEGILGTAASRKQKNTSLLSLQYIMFNTQPVN